MAGGTAIYLVLNRLNIAYDVEELIERIGHERVAENLNNAGMNSTNSEVNSEEPECVRTVLCQAMTRKSVRKADTNWTDQDSEDQKCCSCETVRIGDRVINVECTKQDVIALSAIRSKSYSLTTGELGRVPSENNETDLGTKYLERDRIERCMTKMGKMIVEAWAGEQFLVVSGTGVIIGEDLLEGHSWTMGVVLLVTVGVGLLSCVCAVFDPHLPTGNVHVTREPEVASQPSGMTSRSMRNEIINHLNVTKKDVDSITVFWRSAGAADDVEHAEFSCSREFFDWIAGGGGYWCDFNPSSGVTIASTLRPSAKSGPEKMAA